MPYRSCGSSSVFITLQRPGPTKPCKIQPCFLPDLTSFSSVSVIPFQLPAASQTHWDHSSLRTSDFLCSLPVMRPARVLYLAKNYANISCHFSEAHRQSAVCPLFTHSSILSEQIERTNHSRSRTVWYQAHSEVTDTPVAPSGN